MTSGSGSDDDCGASDGGSPWSPIALDMASTPTEEAIA